jgi:hypothetical protein
MAGQVRREFPPAARAAGMTCICQGSSANFCTANRHKVLANRFRLPRRLESVYCRFFIGLFGHRIALVKMNLWQVLGHRAT